MKCLKRHHSFGKEKTAGIHLINEAKCLTRLISKKLIRYKSYQECEREREVTSLKISQVLQ